MTTDQTVPEMDQRRGIVASPILPEDGAQFLKGTMDQQAYLRGKRERAVEDARIEVEANSPPIRWLQSVLVLLTSGLAAALAIVLPQGRPALLGALTAGAVAIVAAIFPRFGSRAR